MPPTLPAWTVLLLGIIASIQSAISCGVVWHFPLLAIRLRACRNLAKGVSEGSEVGCV